MGGELIAPSPGRLFGKIGDGSRLILSQADWVTNIDLMEPGKLKLHRGMWMGRTPYVFVDHVCWMDAFDYHRKLPLYPLRIKR